MLAVNFLRPDQGSVRNCPGRRPGQFGSRHWSGCIRPQTLAQCRPRKSGDRGPEALVIESCRGGCGGRVYPSPPPFHPLTPHTPHPGQQIRLSIIYGAKRERSASYRSAVQHNGRPEAALQQAVSPVARADHRPTKVVRNQARPRTSTISGRPKNQVLKTLV